MKDLDSLLVLDSSFSHPGPHFRMRESMPYEN